MRIESINIFYATTMIVAAEEGGAVSPLIIAFGTLAMIAIAMIAFAFGMRVMTLVAGAPVHVKVLDKFERESTSEDSSWSQQILNFLVIEVAGNSREIKVGQQLYDDVSIGGDYSVKGKVWADGKFTFVGKWTKVAG